MWESFRHYFPFYIFYKFVNERLKLNLNFWKFVSYSLLPNWCQGIAASNSLNLKIFCQIIFDWFLFRDETGFLHQILYKLCKLMLRLFSPSSSEWVVSQTYISLIQILKIKLLPYICNFINNTVTLHSKPSKMNIIENFNCVNYFNFFLSKQLKQYFSLIC